MTRREFLYRRAREFDWAPGWDAIDAEFARLYPDERPDRAASPVIDRARFGGGEECLDSAALFRSPKGYAHIVAYGMSALEPDIGSFGGECSGWGYEMTAKAAEPYTDDRWWVIGTFASLARYTNTTGRMMAPGYSLVGSGDPICAPISSPARHPFDAGHSPVSMCVATIRANSSGFSPLHAWCTPGAVHVRSWGRHARSGPKARRIEAESCSAHTAKKGPS